MYNLVSINRDDHKENGFPAFVRNTSHIRSDMGSSDCVLAGFCQLQGNLVRLQGQPGLLQIENNNDGCFDWSCLFLITLFGCYFSLAKNPPCFWKYPLGFRINYNNFCLEWLRLFSFHCCFIRGLGI
jgi:hypothetical protein